MRDSVQVDDTSGFFDHRTETIGGKLNYQLGASSRAFVSYEFTRIPPSDERPVVAGPVVHEGRENPERWTFYIDKDGVVKFIDKKVTTDSHGEDIAKKLEELGVAKKK